MLDDFSSNIARDHFYVGRTFGSAFEAVMNEEKGKDMGEGERRNALKRQSFVKKPIKKAAERSTDRIECAR